MRVDQDHIQAGVAVLGAANLVWALGLTLVTTRKADADMRRVAKNLAVSFGDIAAELVRARPRKARQTR
jgi:hypothetical protein